MKRLALIVPTALAVAAGLAVAAPEAHATSEGCTYTRFPSHYVCFRINGEGRHVDTFQVKRGKLDASNDICNHRARVVVRFKGKVVYRRWTTLRRGCDQFRVVRTINVDRNFPSGSRACGSFFENGVLQDKACNKITS